MCENRAQKYNGFRGGWFIDFTSVELTEALRLRVVTNVVSNQL